MNGDVYEVLTRPDKSEQEIQDEIEAQDLEFQVLFFDFIYMTNAYGWSQHEHIETLDNRFQTYVLLVGGDRTRRAMLTREVGLERYYYLGLTTARTPRSARNAVFKAACEAHQLVNPTRTPNPDRR